MGFYLQKYNLIPNYPRKQQENNNMKELKFQQKAVRR